MSKIKIIIIVVTVIALLFLIYYVTRKSKTRTFINEKGEMETKKEQFTDKGAKEALAEIEKAYGKINACITERMFILETGHYKANIFKKTGGAGMTAPNSNYPYGWGSMRSFWDSNKELKPEGTTGKLSNGFNYIVFPTLKAGMFATAEKLRQNNLNAGRWFSKNEKLIAEYNEKIIKIKNKHVEGCSNSDILKYLKTESTGTGESNTIDTPWYLFMF